MEYVEKILIIVISATTALLGKEGVVKLYTLYIKKDQTDTKNKTEQLEILFKEYQSIIHLKQVEADTLKEQVEELRVKMGEIKDEQTQTLIEKLRYRGEVSRLKVELERCHSQLKDSDS